MPMDDDSLCVIFPLRKMPSSSKRHPLSPPSASVDPLSASVTDSNAPQPENAAAGICATPPVKTTFVIEAYGFCGDRPFKTHDGQLRTPPLQFPPPQLHFQQSTRNPPVSRSVRDCWYFESVQSHRERTRLRSFNAKVITTDEFTRSARRAFRMIRPTAIRADPSCRKQGE